MATWFDRRSALEFGKPCVAAGRADRLKTQIDRERMSLVLPNAQIVGRDGKPLLIIRRDHRLDQRSGQRDLSVLSQCDQIPD